MSKLMNIAKRLTTNDNVSLATLDSIEQLLSKVEKVKKEMQTMKSRDLCFDNIVIVHNMIHDYVYRPFHGSMQGLDNWQIDISELYTRAERM